MSALATASGPDSRGYFGRFGGRYVPEVLVEPLRELEDSMRHAFDEDGFWSEFRALLRDYVGRPTPLTEAANLSRSAGGARIFLKREDCNHTGAHKIVNALGQALLARRMGKTRLIAETGAGQHGVAVATAGALLNIPVEVFMGTDDMERQSLNVYLMRTLGAHVRPVGSGSRTLKDATNDALRDWAATLATTAYVIGSAVGPHPYPLLVRSFARVIGDEARAQMLERCGRLPDHVVACVGGGSNSIGTFTAFVDDADVRLWGVEAGGCGVSVPGGHAASLNGGSIGVLHGARTFVLQSAAGAISETHSISAGLDYPAVGPEHAHLRDVGRVKYPCVTDTDARAAFEELARTEGIVPALESAHAIAFARDLASGLSQESLILVTCSGRGDKDAIRFAAAGAS